MYGYVRGLDDDADSVWSNRFRERLGYLLRQSLLN